MQDDEAASNLRVGGWLPDQRHEAAVGHGWPGSDETMVLPTFVTGASSPPVTPPTPVAAPAAARPVDPDRLPSSERNMLIFVASILAVGTLAIVATMGLGRLAGNEASPLAGSPTAGTSGSPRADVGRPDLEAYCDAVAAHPVLRPPGAGRDTWTCAATAFTPTDVCHAQFGAATVAGYQALADPATWHCYRD